MEGGYTLQKTAETFGFRKFGTNFNKDKFVELQK